MLSIALKAIASAWDRLWFRPVDPLPGSLFRIALGLLLIATYLALGPNWERYFASDGVLSMTDPTLSTYAEDWWSLFYWLPRTPVGLFWTAGLVAAVGFCVGYKTRACTITLFILTMSVVHRNRFAINGEDLVARMVLFYACFARLGETLSVDSWLRRRANRDSAPPPPVPARVWPIRLMQINVALIYAISLPNKIADDPAWLSGEAIYLSLANSTWGRFPWPVLFAGVLSQAFTYFTILAEGAFPVLVWFPRTRLYALAALASLHLGIAIMLQNVTFFSLSMVCCFIVFLPAPLLRRVLRRAASMVPALTPLQLTWDEREREHS